MSLAENTGSIANASFVANINEDSTSKFNKELRGTCYKNIFRR
jgi:MFS superfamily sulfate permease-like transporter